MTKTPPPVGYIMHKSQRDLSKFLGFSKSGGSYAYQEYLYDEETGEKMWVNIYINDSLLGKYPRNTHFIWTIEDQYRIANSNADIIAARDSGSQFEKDSYQRFVDKYYPEGLPKHLLNLEQSNQFYGVHQLDNSEWYVQDYNKILIRGREIEMKGNTINIGLLENDSIYYLRKRDNWCILYINFKMVYGSPRIDRVTVAGNSLKFYAYKGDKVYWVTCSATSNEE